VFVTDNNYIVSEAGTLFILPIKFRRTLFLKRLCVSALMFETEYVYRLQMPNIPFYTATL